MLIKERNASRQHAAAKGQSEDEVISWRWILVMDLGCGSKDSVRLAVLMAPHFNHTLF
jgi:hypothetical protein